MIVVDTNVLSELMRSAPAERVRLWVEVQPARELFTSAITVAEVLYGIERLVPGRRQSQLRTAATDVFNDFAGQVLPFDENAAREYAQVVSHRKRLGKPIEGFDAQIASICRARTAILATRNVSDFRETGIEIVNPFL